SLDPAKAPLILERIGQLVETAQLYRDLECDQAPTIEQLPQFLGRVDGYLCEIKEAQIRDGLHILGRLPEGEQFIDLLLSLVRVDNGDVPGLIKALALDLGLDYDELRRDPAAAPSFPHSAAERGNDGWRTCGDVVEALGQLGRMLVEECWREQS